MKKNYLIIIVFIAFSLNGFSQFEIKGFGGVNASSLSNLEEGFTQKSNVSYQVGASILFGTTFYGELGATWAVNSQTITDPLDAVSAKSTISGVKVPLLVGYRFFGRSENLVNLRLFLGATANFATGVKLGDISLDKDFYNSLLWSANFGAGIDVLFLFADLGYELGLSEVFKDVDNSAKVNNFYLNIGVRIMFGNSSRGRSKHR